MQRAAALNTKNACSNDETIAKVYGELINAPTPGESAGMVRAKSHGKMPRTTHPWNRHRARSRSVTFQEPGPAQPSAGHGSDTECVVTEVAAETPAAGASAGRDNLVFTSQDSDGAHCRL